MLDLEKLQNQSERFAHLVTFKNTNGFNGRSTRLSLPNRFSKINRYDSHPRITFDENTLTIKFRYIPNDNSFKLFNELAIEARGNKGLRGFFKKSDEKFKLQVFPKGDLDGCLMIWDGIKLKKVKSKFVDDDTDTNLIETVLEFSFTKTDYTYLSKAAEASNEHIERSMEVFNEYIEKVHNDDNRLRRTCKDENYGWAPIVPETILEQFKDCNEKICETNESEESENKSTN